MLPTTAKWKTRKRRWYTTQSDDCSPTWLTWSVLNTLLPQKIGRWRSPLLNLSLISCTISCIIQQDLTKSPLKPRTISIRRHKKWPLWWKNPPSLIRYFSYSQDKEHFKMKLCADLLLLSRLLGSCFRTLELEVRCGNVYKVVDRYFSREEFCEECSLDPALKEYNGLYYQVSTEVSRRRASLFEKVMGGCVQRLQVVFKPPFTFTSEDGIVEGRRCGTVPDGVRGVNGEKETLI